MNEFVTGMDSIVASMEDIRSASEETGESIGEQGKGFAVVADGVRSLGDMQNETIEATAKFFLDYLASSGTVFSYGSYASAGVLP